MMQHPFGAYMSWPPLRGGYSKPINLSQMHYKAGGKVPLDVTTTKRERTPEQLAELLDRIETQNPAVSTDKWFSYLCARTPEVRRVFHAMLSQRDYSRGGCAAMIMGAIRRGDDPASLLSD